jgi:hypothetical protein
MTIQVKRIAVLPSPTMHRIDALLALGGTRPLSVYFKLRMRSDGSTFTNVGLLMAIARINNLDICGFIRGLGTGAMVLEALCDVNNSKR